MTAQHLLEAIGLIDDRFIAEAEMVHYSTSRRIWVRWAAAAACVLIILTAAIPMLLNGIGMGGTAADSAMPESGESANMQESAAEGTGESGATTETALIVFENAVYSPSELFYGISEDTFRKETGDFIGTGESSGEQVELYSLENGGRELVAAVYADGTFEYLQYAGRADGAALSGQDLFSLYGVQSASQIEQATLVRAEGTQTDVETDDVWLEQFYNAVVTLQAVPASGRPETEAGIAVQLLLADDGTIELEWYPQNGLLLSKSLEFELDGQTAMLLDALITQE